MKLTKKNWQQEIALVHSRALVEILFQISPRSKIVQDTLDDLYDCIGSLENDESLRDK